MISVLIGCNKTERPLSQIGFVTLPEGWIQPQVEYVNDVVHILYYLGDAGGGDLFYTNYDVEKGNFAKSKRVNHQDSVAIAAGTIRGGQLAVATDGTVHVLWNGSGASAIRVNDSLRHTPLHYSRMLPGRSFEYERNLIDQAWGLDGGSDITVDEKGRVFVAWHGKGKQKGENYRRVYMRSSEDGGQDFSKERAVNDEEAGVCGCCGLHINVDNANAPTIIYRSATGGKSRDIRMLSLNPAGGVDDDHVVDKWELDACPMSSINSTVNADALWLTWEKEGKIFYRGKETGLPIHSPQSQGEGAKHSKIVKSDSGYTLVCWTEGTGWNRGGNLAWELTDPDGQVIESGKRERAIEVWDFPAVAYAGEGQFLIFH
ncbi:MAG: hypothetical protein OEX02_13215 [Cyclobacteriaceae bacterium]|nr:hypothetical protein [Cyclobacteriaceae bacterium]